MIQSLKNPQFRVVYDRGKSRSDRYLVMYVYPNGLSINRLGITVSKRNGNSVVRSRLKRIIKEAYRQQQYDKLADIIRENMDMKAIYEILEKGNHTS